MEKIKCIMDEVLSDIEGYEGLYAVNKNGDVLSMLLKSLRYCT